MCYKPSIVPRLEQEVLTQRLLSRPRLSQPTLFHPPHPRPSFQTLPNEFGADASNVAYPRAVVCLKETSPMDTSPLRIGYCQSLSGALASNGKTADSPTWVDERPLAWQRRNTRSCKSHGIVGAAGRVGGYALRYGHSSW